MKQTILCLAFLGFLPVVAEAGVMLGTTNPDGDPLSMSSGTTSGTMYVTVASDNVPNDVMAGWQFQLVIVSLGSTTGTVTFQDPAAGTAPNPPPNYIFGNHGLGISVPTNTGTQLDANDFDANLGTVVPASAANLLGIDFLASGNASGTFGIYAVEGDANTVWTDSGFNTQYFTNVPDGTGEVLIGEVSVSPSSVSSTPEPSSLALLGIGSAALAGWRWRRRR